MKNPRANLKKERNNKFEDDFDLMSKLNVEME